MGQTKLRTEWYRLNFTDTIRRTGKFIVAAMAIVQLSGCSDAEHREENENGRQVRFYVGIQASGRTTDGGESWADGDQVGLYMVDSGGTLPDAILSVGGIPANNREYDVIPATGELIPAGGPPVCYPQSGITDFIAYYPYTAGISESRHYPVTVAGQTSETRQNTLDVLWTRTSGVVKSKAPVNLSFCHILSRVTFNITPAAIPGRLTSNDLTAVRFSGMPETAILDLNDGRLTAGSAGDFTALKVGKAQANAMSTFTALVIPQDRGSGRKVVFTVGGQDYCWNIPDSETFKAGQHYTYPVTVNVDNVVVGSPDIISWIIRDHGRL